MRGQKLQWGIGKNRSQTSRHKVALIEQFLYLHNISELDHFFSPKFSNSLKSKNRRSQLFTHKPNLISNWLYNDIKWNSSDLFPRINSTIKAAEVKIFEMVGDFFHDLE